MPNTSRGGAKVQATSEAKWIAEQVVAGRMTAEDAVDLIAIPDEAWERWFEVADEDLQIELAQAGLFRLMCALKFLEILARSKRVKVKRAKIIVRKQRSHGVRLPVLHSANVVLANTEPQEPRSPVVSL